MFAGRHAVQRMPLGQAGLAHFAIGNEGVGVLVRLAEGGGDIVVFLLKREGQ